MNQALNDLLAKFRRDAKTEREKGTYFEELILTYLRHEATYRDLYAQVWTYADWAKEQGLDGKDAGIDLVAKTSGTDEYHAIQCKFFDEGYKVQKKDIDSFFTASGKKPFTHRVIVTTTNNWSEHAEAALQGQNPPVIKIDLHDLANSQIDWAKYQSKHEPTLKKKNDLRPHQIRALIDVEKGFETAERGKLIMACGTGKTFTSLKIAENIAGKGKRVLFLVPSLSLLSQTLTEWTQQSLTPLHSFAVCSDSDIGKKRKTDDDTVQTFMHELRYPATTDAKSLAREMDKRYDKAHMSVVFSTYHSIDVIGEAQKKYGLADFDLIICDEAHRTTGATFADEKEDESNFVKIHDNKNVNGKKRLYMTATPRIYTDAAEVRAEREDTKLYGMNDESLYGKELHVLTFSEAVMRGLLVDYKVIVLAMDEAHVSARIQRALKDESNQLRVDDAAKIIGCWKALSKQHQNDDTDDREPMRRAVAFCQVIEQQKGARVHKVSSKNIASMFQTVVDEYQEQEEGHNTLKCEAEHIDGSMNASEKEKKLEWLKEALPEDTCRILSNVRCLSEGVDVPALDAVLFLTPRNSPVDVVQSVGRIMRTTPDGKKKRGYVILPVVIPNDKTPEEALNDNKTYRVVWEVLQALRSHDDRFDAMINKFDLVGKDHSKLEVISVTGMEVVAKVDKVKPKQKRNKRKETGRGENTIGTPEQAKPEQFKIQFQIGEIERALYAKMVEKCGNRRHWEEWAKDIARIAQTHIARIRAIVSDPKNEVEVEAFTDFAEELRDDLNDQITNEEVIEMLAQHLITKPVFDALFDKYSFASKNPVSLAMQNVLDVLQKHKISEKEADTLEKFYSSVKLRAEKIEDSKAKQKIIRELYDRFFNEAFPNLSKKMGIVYTPEEVVDFMIHSVNDVLQHEFGKTLGSKGVHILDPFTGTGMFITRLLQSGLIDTKDLPHKYAHEIHANEIVLLAYYIAAINIEAVYHGIAGGDYKPFQGILLTDTFRLNEKDLISRLLADNSERRKRQQALDIRVIVANPPYSEGQESGNDNAQNVEYPHLDERIRETYGAQSTAGLQNSLFNSYIRAFRWASDRVGDCGIVAFVSGAGWITANSLDGMRKCLAEEFSDLYIFHLRGNQRTSGETSRKEGGKIFGSGSRSPIAISVLVKNPDAKERGKIHFHDIGDYLTREQKLEIISDFKSIKGIEVQKKWASITPDKHGDWLNQRDDSFDDYICIVDKEGEGIPSIFSISSSGIKTNRDPWCYNASKKAVSTNMERMIAFYNDELKAYKKKYPSKNSAPNPEDVVDKDPKKIKWTREIFASVRSGREGIFNSKHVVQSAYRPFNKEWAYFDRHFNNCVYQMPSIFPDDEVENLVIALTGPGAGGDFSALITNTLPNLHFQSTSNCFPLYLYESSATDSDDLFKGKKSDAGYKKKDGITDAGLAYFKMAYPSEKIGKEDVFYYIYGLLHSKEYREKYADNLSKQLPRIPCVKKAMDFWAFSKAGRALADLHVSYETVKPHEVTLDTGSRKLKDFGGDEYYVKKMKFAKKGDKSTVIYNDFITIRDIPLDAYDYVVNGKSALEWVMERQGVKPDKVSGIVNDANLYATETVGDPAYPLKLFQRIITVSLETMKIVRSLPKLDIQAPKKEKVA